MEADAILLSICLHIWLSTVNADTAQSWDINTPNLAFMELCDLPSWFRRMPYSNLSFLKEGHWTSQNFCPSVLSYKWHFKRTCCSGLRTVSFINSAQLVFNHLMYLFLVLFHLWTFRSQDPLYSLCRKSFCCMFELYVFKNTASEFSCSSQHRKKPCFSFKSWRRLTLKADLLHSFARVTATVLWIVCFVSVALELSGCVLCY